MKGLLAVAIESGRVIWWVAFPCAGHHHDHNLLLGLHQAIHTQLIERQNLHACIMHMTFTNIAASLFTCVTITTMSLTQVVLQGG